MDKWTVELTPQELMQAAMVGVMRAVSCIRDGRQHKHGANIDESWQMQIEGACGEAAHAKASGVWWSASVNTFKSEGDVGAVEVRTRSKDDYDLIVRKDDRDDAIYVLVVGRAPCFRVVGWIHGLEAKAPVFLASHGGREEAYFVPQSALNKME